jgi:hypothetical protein
MKITNYEAPNYVVFTIPLLPRLPSAQMSTSASCCLTPSAYVPPSCPSRRYKTGKIAVLCILIFTFLDSKLEDKRFCTEG